MPKIKSSLYNPDIKTSIAACKIVACKPARQYWLELFTENKEIFRKVDYITVSNIIHVNDCIINNLIKYYNLSKLKNKG